MSEHTRVSFRIPDQYSEILDLVARYQGVVDGAAFSQADYDEFFALHVDEVIETRFLFNNGEAAENALTALFEVFDRMALPHVIVTTSVPDSMRTISKPPTGIAYVNEFGGQEGLRTLPLYSAFSPDDGNKDTIAQDGLPRRFFFGRPPRNENVGPRLGG